ncbi:MAG: TIGR03619 family F420-dependent LLM class oxidoreductase [Deltaproteobacteria bacterium]|nr:TIGR03619 family F420-dependent LLM class oxidoreductase [Deltaproteobacteria bacterium]MBW2419562.1 TIGR03619 family F420-dependent LLM class oxidoreductase [Deltaproteobacteria bacterium]
MKFGIHLPQAGPAATADAIRAAARQAEELGFSDVWVSDHLAVPKNAPYPPSAYILEPLIALTWAAAATERVGLGTTVLVLPLRPPVLLAKMLASLDLMSGGRVIVGAAGGWLKEEFDALGVPFEERGARTDETIDILRRCWTEDPIDAQAPLTGVSMVEMRAKPQPERAIPIWIGGHSEPAYRRAVRVGDGWHGGFQPPDKVKVIVERLRRDRPEESFTLSMRTRWDALKDDADEILRELEQYAEVGIQHIVAEPAQRDQDSWLRCGEAFAKIFERMGG